MGVLFFRAMFVQTNRVLRKKIYRRAVLDGLGGRVFLLTRAFWRARYCRIEIRKTVRVVADQFQCRSDPGRFPTLSTFPGRCGYTKSFQVSVISSTYELEEMVFP